MTDKICALIRQTWYETAKKNLKPEERLRFYETCFEYEFSDTAPADDIPFAARLLFDMVRNDIDGDKQRAKDRAERSRINGTKGGRPKVTTENTNETNPEKPTGFSSNPIYKHQYTTNTNTQQNVSEDNADEDAHKIFDCCLIFFARGCKDAVAECQTFWNYYKSLGWKTKSGGEIVDKKALAEAWRLSDISAASIRRRAAWVDMLREVHTCDMRYIAEFIDITKDTEQKKIVVTMQTRIACTSFDLLFCNNAKIWWQKWAPGYVLVYRWLQETL